MKQIPLTQGQIALVDDSDYERIKAYKWYAQRGGNTFYAQRRLGMGILALHTFLTGWARVDHVNGNGLDNRRVNLRPATNAQNSANSRKRKSTSSAFKGVSWNRQSKKWLATIRVDRKLINLGYYTSELDAAAAYDFAATKYFGEYACTNESMGLFERKL